MIYFGLYLLIGFGFAHLFLKLVHRKAEKEIETGTVTSDTETIMRESDKLQNAIGYKSFITILYALLALVWFPAACYIAIKLAVKRFKG